MRKSIFGLKVVGGKELSTGMTSLHHKQKFAIRLCNYSHNLSCNAELKVNGKVIGKYRVEAYKCIFIERPLHDDGCFTFYKHGSGEAEKIGLIGQDSDGVIEVIFTPEIDELPLCLYKRSNDSLVTGGVGLSGQSQQKFIKASHIAEDIKQAILIKTRLVCDDEPRSL